MNRLFGKFTGNISKLSDENRKKYGLWLGISILMIYLASKSLTMLLIGALCFMAANLSSNKAGIKSLFLAPLPLICSLILGWTLASGLFWFQSFGAEVMGKPKPQIIVWQSWYDSPFRPLTNPANRVGRGGAIGGAIIGLFFAHFIPKRNGWHGPGVVRGEQVTQGGWADLTHLQDKCDFGPPKDGAGGVPIGRLGGQIVRVNPLKGLIKMAGHLIAVGATGVGKSFTLIRMLIIAAVCDRDSIVVADPKGELFYDMARWLQKRGYNVIPFNVVDPQYSLWWNMVEECRSFDEIMDLADWLISAAGDDHAFFSGGEKNVLTASFAYVKYAMPQGLNHPTAALSILSWPQEYLDFCFDAAFRQRSSTGFPDEAYETWKGVQGKYTNYIEGVRNKIRDITKGQLAALTSKSDFSLDIVGKQKTAIFLILPTENVELKSLLVPFYGFMFKRLNELAASSPNGRLPVGVRFILDELGNIGRIPGLDDVTALGRSKGIMAQMTVQNIGQLKTLYSKIWEAIAGNCPIKLCLAVDDMTSAQFFSRMAGGAQVKHVSVSRDVSNPITAMRLPKKREGSKDVDVLKPYELLQLPEKDCVALLRGKRPLYLEKIAWTDLPQYPEIREAGTCTPAEFMEEPRSLTIQRPPYPQCNTENNPEPERSRNTKSIKTVKRPADKLNAESPSIADLGELFNLSDDDRSRAANEYL